MLDLTTSAVLYKNSLLNWLIRIDQLFDNAIDHLPDILDLMLNVLPVGCKSLFD